MHLAWSVHHLLGGHVRSLKPWSTILPVAARITSIVTLLLITHLIVISTIPSRISPETSRYMARGVVVIELARKSPSILKISTTILFWRPVSLVVYCVFSICPFIGYLHECRYGLRVSSP